MNGSLNIIQHSDSRRLVGQGDAVVGDAGGLSGKTIGEFIEIVGGSNLGNFLRAATKVFAEVSKLFESKIAPALSIVLVEAGASIDALGVEKYWESIKPYEELLLGYGYSVEEARSWLGLRWSYIDRYVSQTNEARRSLRPLFKDLAAISSNDALVKSRRAKKLLVLLGNMKAAQIIESALEKAEFRDQGDEFREVVILAARKDKSAIGALTSMAASLLPHMPDPRGRDLSFATALHLYLHIDLMFRGHGQAYTFGGDGEKGDYVDKPTKATRALLGKPRFEPTEARRRVCEYISREKLETNFPRSARRPPNRGRA